MILKRHSVFDTLADYDPVMGTFLTFSRASEPVRASGQVSGTFDYLGGKRILLFRHAGVLYLQVDSQRVTMADHTIELQTVGGRRVLRVLSGTRIVLELTYVPPLIEPPLSEDPTPFVEEEHFDLGLFLASLSRDRGRQGRVYAGY
jgi:hypothetical protein